MFSTGANPVATKAVLPLPTMVAFVQHIRFVKQSFMPIGSPKSLRAQSNLLYITILSTQAEGSAGFYASNTS